MIKAHDIEKIDIPHTVLNYCKNNPQEGCSQPINGQLKTLGMYVLSRIVGWDYDELIAHLPQAQQLGVSCVCEDDNQKIVGISPATSLVRDHDIMLKNIIVPTKQITKHPHIDYHNCLINYVVGFKNDDNTLGRVDAVYCAGWAPMSRILWFDTDNGSHLFRRKNLAIAPLVPVAKPLYQLLNMVRWHHACV